MGGDEIRVRDREVQFGGYRVTGMEIYGITWEYMV